MDRRQLLLTCASLALSCRATPASRRPSANARDRRFAITIDDPSTEETPRYSADERNRLILAQLAAHGAQAMLFVCGKRIDSPQGAELLSAFNRAGHLLANHSYSHLNFSAPANDAEVFAGEVARSEALIAR